MEFFDLVIEGEPVYIAGKDCGYCHGKKEPMENGYSLQSYRDEFLKATNEETDSQYSTYPNSTSMCFHVYLFTPECYEDLMNRGFRRSGKLLYRPDLLRNCCRMYPIRTNFTLFKASKEHRHTINRFYKHLGVSGNGKRSKRQPFDLLQRVLDTELSVPESKFHTVIGPPDSTPEKFQLYRKYQIAVHNDDPEEVKEKGFKRFLCDSPFSPSIVTRRSDSYWRELNDWRNRKANNETFVGPVHECYYLDGKLVAIAVLDLLPNSISSVYFIWDPNYAHLGLGTLSALREIVLAEQLGKEYYYMGYYIDDCAKMRYKAKFGGEILDLCSRKYLALDHVNKVTCAADLVVTAETEGDSDTALNEFEVVDELIEKVPTRLVNVAEQIYGVRGGSFAKARKMAAQLAEIEGLEEFSEWEQDDEIWRSREEYQRFTLPLVSPGLIPLWQVHELNTTGELNHIFQNSFVLSQTSAGQVVPFRFGNSEYSEYRKPFVDLLRLIGVQQFKGNVLLVT